MTTPTGGFIDEPLIVDEVQRVGRDGCLLGMASRDGRAMRARWGLGATHIGGRYAATWQHLGGCSSSMVYLSKNESARALIIN